MESYPGQPLTVTIGVDLGQKVDPTAIAVVEEQHRPLGGAEGESGRFQRVPTEDHYVVRDLARLPLGTPYPKVADTIAAVVQALTPRMGRNPWTRQAQPPRLTLFVDATGVGQPVVDLLSAAGVRVQAVYFTHGDRRTVEAGYVTLGKAWLVSRLQALLQTSRIHLPDTDEARELARELQNYEIKIDQDANDRYGAFRVGTHDDLVTALGLAVQTPQPRYEVDPEVIRRLRDW